MGGPSRADGPMVPSASERSIPWPDPAAVEGQRASAGRPVGTGVIDDASGPSSGRTTGDG